MNTTSPGNLPGLFSFLRLRFGRFPIPGLSRAGVARVTGQPRRPNRNTAQSPKSLSSLALTRDRVNRPSAPLERTGMWSLVASLPASRSMKLAIRRRGLSEGRARLPQRARWTPEVVPSGSVTALGTQKSSATALPAAPISR